jgi:hypothetical protein
MNLGLAKRLLSEIAALGIAPKVTFHVMGEPTLHPHFFEILCFANRLGLQTSLVTNAMHMGDDVGRELARHPLDELTFSIQTPDAESFSHRVAPIGFDDYRNGILDFFRSHYQNQAGTCFYLRFLSTFLFEKTHAVHGLYGATCSQFSQLRAAIAIWARDILEAIGVSQESIELEIARLTRLRLYRWNRIELRQRLQFDIWPMLDWRDWATCSCCPEVETGDCIHHHDHLAVLSNGEVVLCCMDFNGRTSLGNVGNCLLTDILQGDRARYVLGEFARGRIALSFCRRCLGSWQKTLSELREGKPVYVTQRAIETTLQSACRLWD